MTARRQIRQRPGIIGRAVHDSVPTIGPNGYIGHTVTIDMRPEPCPWCGSRAGLTYEHDASRVGKRGFDGLARCRDCGGS